MDRRLRNYIGLTCLIITIVIGSTAFILINSKSNIMTVQQRMDGVTEIQLSRWVYDNSTRISKATSAEIVRATMTTKYPLAMLSIIELESVKFTPGSLSSVGAIGWCQVRYEVHGPALIKAGIIKEKRDLWDVGPNIRAGAFIFEMYLEQNKGDVPRTLSNYLGGKDGAYQLRILTTYANLSVLTNRIVVGDARLADKVRQIPAIPY